MLPNLIIAGAPKCGTSSLFKWLADHPQVVGSKVKETCYFVDPESHTYDPRSHFANSGMEGYQQLFENPSNKAEKVVVEATPSYLYSNLALKKLPDLPSKPKFLFIVRDPAEQLLSLFKYFRENWDYVPSDLTFRDFIAASAAGRDQFHGNELAQHAVRNAHYIRFLELWHERCGGDRISVFAFEHVFRDPSSFMIRLAKMLGLDASFYANYGFPGENRTYLTRSRILQKINLRVRATIPRGPVYEGLRSLYRFVNTSAPEIQPDERLVQKDLRGMYSSSNAELCNRYQIDVNSWV